MNLIAFFQSSVLKITGLLVLCTLTSSPWADTFTVDNTADPFPTGNCDDNLTQDCSVREAIINANTTPGPDTIIIPAGTYLLTRPGLNEDASVTGDLDINDAVQILGAGVEHTIIDAGGAGGINDRVIHILNASGTEIYDLTIRGGLLQADDLSAIGGGIYAESNTLLSTIRLHNNEAYAGGALFHHAALTIEDSEILQNLARHTGGGIASLFEITLINSLIANNQAHIDAGGLYIRAGGSLTQTNIINNHANASGGGLFVNLPTIAPPVTHDQWFTEQTTHLLSRGDPILFLDQLTIEGNSAAINGGGLWSNGEVIIEQVNITANVSEANGGAIYQENGFISLSQSTLSHNQANNALAVYILAGSMVMANATISSHMADAFTVWIEEPGRMALLHASYFNNRNSSPITHATLMAAMNAQVFFRNSLIDQGCIGTGVFNSLGGNIESPGNTCQLTAINDLTLEPDLKLRPLSNNGGLTATHLPLPDSPAIDHIANADCSTITTDQRGQARPVSFFNMGINCDVGAIEMQDLIFADGYQ